MGYRVRSSMKGSYVKLNWVSTFSGKGQWEIVTPTYKHFNKQRQDKMKRKRLTYFVAVFAFIVLSAGLSRAVPSSDTICD